MTDHKVSGKIGTMPSPKHDVKPGMQFGCLTVKGNHNGEWVCLCVCGGERTMTRRLLKHKQHKWCSCSRVSGKKMSEYPEYKVWNGIKDRVSRENNDKFKNYGGRGISMCERWTRSFFLFYKDMGPRPSPKHTIERKNNNGNYEPGNCVWVTDDVQRRNKTNSKNLTHEGRTLCMTDWAKLKGMKPGTLARRLKDGWSVDRALTTPVAAWNR